MGVGTTPLAIRHVITERVRDAYPTWLISGDAVPASLGEAKAGGYRLLLKPMSPGKLRALIEHLAAASPPQPGRPVDDGQGLPIIPAALPDS
jgi:hypothetical protein